MVTKAPAKKRTVKKKAASRTSSKLGNNQIPAPKKRAVKKTPVRKKAAVKKKAAPKKKAAHTGTHGGARPGGGRKKGAATTRTRKIADDLANDETQLTPLEYMLQTLNTTPESLKAQLAAKEIDEQEYVLKLQELTERRDWAAEKAAPYIHPRLASIEAKVDASGHEKWLGMIYESEDSPE